ncbi:MAG: ATP-binding protein [Gammaproteobacteria bacterium]|nr:ATP-binding protein [Gammaproteobacteria bacterium]
MFAANEFFYLVIAIVVLLILLVLFYQPSLLRLRKRVLDAREGLLLPVDMPAIAPPFIRSLLNDYNTTILTLGSMFKTVEECQSRVMEERNRINAILQSMPGVLFTVSNELTINIANKLAEATFSTENKSLIGTNIFDLVRFNEIDRNILRDSFLYKQPIRNLEILLDVKSGQRWFSLNVSFFSEQDEEMEAILTLLDINENRDLQETLASREKLVAMGQLAAGIAHELNTPLGNILGYIQLIKTEIPKNNISLDYASIVEEETRRCSQIIGDLLSFANHEKCSGETCDVNQLLSNITETFLSCRTRRYGIEIKIELEHNLPPAEGDCGQLEIVLTNLILNSIHALDGVASPEIILRSWQQGNDYVNVSVVDNGPGIPVDIRQNIFNPFFTTKDVGSGSGLGLSISQALLTKRGGFIKYDPEYEQGARFIIGLPLVDLQRDVT